MYGLSREASAVRKDSNNECRGVSRGRSSRPRDGQGEGPNRALSYKTICVFGNCSSQMAEEELSFQDDRAYPDNREEVTMSNMRSPKGTRQARNRRMPNGTYGGVGGRKTKVGQKTYYVFRPTRLYVVYILVCFVSYLPHYTHLFVPLLEKMRFLLCLLCKFASANILYDDKHFANLLFQPIFLVVGLDLLRYPLPFFG